MSPDGEPPVRSRRQRVVRWVGLLGVLVAAVVGGWLAVYFAFSDSDKKGVLASESTAVETTIASTAAPQVGTTSTTVLVATTVATTTTAGPATTPGGQPTATTSTVAALPTTTQGSTTIAPATTRAPTTTAAPTTTTAQPATTTAGTSSGVPNTLPDGSYPPVLAVFDTDTITLWGSVPSEAASQRLQALGLANSKTPATITNLMTIDPRVPAGVGVRVIELNSVRFPPGSSEVLPPHAAELDRIVAIMNALPNITVLVVGHADQVGDEVANFALSEARARSVVTYMVSQGILPSRLSSRAVGEEDLLLLDDDATSLALNRRTEFVIYGLLIGA